MRRKNNKKSEIELNNIYFSRWIGFLLGHVGFGPT
jgi:hypothetical protein